MFFEDIGGLAMAAPGDGPEIIGLESEYVQTNCILADGGDRYGVSAVTFDSTEELLWMGNEGGHVTSYFSGHLQKYTSFQVHASEEVRQIITLNDAILALTPGSLRCQMRRGIPIYTHKSNNINDMQCMLNLPRDRLLIGGHHEKLVEFNLDHCKEVKVVDVGQSGCVMLRPHSRFVCAGNPLGQIDLRDPNTLKIEHTLKTHSGSLSDFDVQGTLLVTCGFSNRQGNLQVDRFLMVYDLRMLRAISPMQTVFDPLYLRFLPSLTSRLAVVSALGQVQILDTITLDQPRLCLMQMENPGAMCLAFDISSSSQSIAFGDNAGSIHLFTSADQAVFNNFSRLTEHADSIVSYPCFDIDDYETPLSSIPMSIVPSDVPLASDWPEHLTRKVYRKPVGIDSEILRTMTMKGPFGYAPNPKTTKRNQVMYDLTNHLTKSPSKHDSHNVNKFDEASNSSFIAIPKRYRKVDVKYNKLGTDELHFDQFNKTRLTGLEATLPNAYCNAMIQVLYYVEPLRAALLSHLCNKEFCLSCELGFLFYMLDTSNNIPCQPGNFLRAFRTVPEVSALGLIIGDLAPDAKVKTDLASLIQSWNRFIIHQMHVELAETRQKNQTTIGEVFATPTSGSDAYNSEFPSIDDSRKKSSSSTGGKDKIKTNNNKKRIYESEVQELVGTKLKQINICTRCKSDNKKETMPLVCNLIYPTSEPEKDEWSFCDILSKSLCSAQTTPAWCERCKKFMPTQQIKEIKALPKLLAINTGLHTTQHKQFWQTQMDKIVAKVVGCSSNGGSNHGGDGDSTTTTTVITPTTSNSNIMMSHQQQQQQSNILTTSKQCRYGDSCTRPGCRFRHSFDNVPAPAPTNNIYCSNNWLPHSIAISLNDSQLIVEKIEKDEQQLLSMNNTTVINNNNNTTVNSDNDEDLLTINNDNNKSDLTTKNYELTAVVCFIDHQQSGNLVALIKVPSTYNMATTPITTATVTPTLNNDHQWFLFNDFSICPVSEQEAVWFSLDWKIPCVLYYSTPEVIHAKSPIHRPFSRAVFAEASLSKSSASLNSAITFTPLADDEFPKRGDLVAIDAEFVTLNQEEAELSRDGKMSTIKPSQLSVARITCIRGYGALEGRPFIDDYILTQEQVVDYLTKFSGIKPGDLDANFSSKHLSTLKSTYSKLRLLQDSGVVFVGHGLKNDFRVINLVVPPDQVADTVLLFHLPHHRMVSLRFLSWHFLGLKIQSETHDSVEDARAALQLYKKYKELESQQMVGEALRDLYDTGKTYNWKVPDDQ